MFNREVHHEFNPEDGDRKIVTERLDGTTDEQDDAAAEAWLVSRETQVAERLEQFKHGQVKEALENIHEEVSSILDRFGYQDLSDEAMEQFRLMREKQIEEFYTNHSQELVNSILGDLKVRGESGT